MKVLIVDDEPPARTELRQLLSLHPGVTVAAEAADVASALELTAKHQPTLVFLDIHLRDESGFDYIAGLDRPTPPRIIFVTAHDTYAVRAFECNALDYLLKPVHPERLAESLNRLPAEAAAPARRAAEDDVVFIKAGAAVRFVPWREVVSITAEGNYTRVHLTDGTCPFVRRPLKEWQSLAPADLFLQVHRSAMVQVPMIQELRAVAEKKSELLLSDGQLIAVGRDYAPIVRRAIGL